MGLPFCGKSDQRFREADMALEDHIRSLREKHASLDHAITKEATRSLPDDAKLAEWKREKLRLKDMIVELSRAAQP